MRSSACCLKAAKQKHFVAPEVNQACYFSAFPYQMATSIYLSQNCRLYYTLCISHTDLENIACLANSVSSGGTVTICPVSVSLAHLGSSGSTTFFLCTEKNVKLTCNSLFYLLLHKYEKLQNFLKPGRSFLPSAVMFGGVC